MIVDWLIERVGAGNFQFVPESAFDLLGNGEDDEFADGEEFETTGERVDS